MYEHSIREADLLLRIKNLKAKVAAYESGEQILRLEETHRRDMADAAREISRLKEELARAHADNSRMRRLWLQANEDVLREKEAELAAKDRELERTRILMYEAQRQRDEEHEKSRQRTIELYDAKTELEEANGRILQLTAMLDRDHTNSSKPSSMSPNHKKIQNSREKTGRRPGGQPGHAHHGRKRGKPTRTVEIPAPDEYADGRGYRPSGEMVRRQLVIFRATAEVVEFVTPEFVCTATGKRCHADFPAGVDDDVNYDASVKAVAYMINNGCNVSIGKTGDFLREISGGRIDLSDGMICGLSEEFSKKTADERDAIFRKLLSSQVMNVDFTFGRVNGKQGTVTICAADGDVLYQSREKKGHEGVKGSPAELYRGTIVSDHEAAFQSCGTRHQECLAHVERYLRSSIENEPNLEWNRRMLEWVRKTIHRRNEAARDGTTPTDDETKSLETEYGDIMEKARSEYEDEPPPKYFPDGYNLYRRMAEDRQDYTLFLHDLSVPPTNNRAENLARKYKRKSAQTMGFRSMEGQSNFCDGLSIMETIKARGENLYDGITARFKKT